MSHLLSLLFFNLLKKSSCAWGDNSINLSLWINTCISSPVLTIEAKEAILSNARIGLMIKVILVKWWGVVQCIFLFVNRWERGRRRPVLIGGRSGLLSIDGRLWMSILVIRGIKCTWAHIGGLFKERSGGLLGPEGAIYHRVTRPPLHIIRVIGTWVDLTTTHDSRGTKHHLLFWPASSCPEADSCGRIIGLHKSIGVCPGNGVGLRNKCGFVGVLLATESTVLSNWSCCHCI
jgi:hypothetical protein